MQANKPEKCNTVSFLLLFVILLSFGIFPPAIALTPAGTVIENVATVEYDGGSLSSNVASLTVTQLAGITLEAGATALADLPGQTLYYPLTLTNVGNFSDNFQLSAVSQQGWTVKLIQDANGDGVHQTAEQTQITAAGTLDLQGHFHYFAALTLPASAAANARDQLTLTACYASNTAWQEQITCAATVQSVAGVTLLPAQTLLTALPSEELYLDFTLTNSGNQTNTYTLSASSPQGWSVEIIADSNQDGIHQSSETGLLDTTIPLAGGEQRKGFLHTATPADFSEGASGSVHLQAVSVADAAVTASAEYSIACKTTPLGDITGDGTVGVDDTNAIAQIALGTGSWTADQVSRADVNGDGEVNVLDITCLLNLIGAKLSTLIASNTTRQLTLPVTTAAAGASKALGVTIDQGAAIVGFQATILLGSDILTVSQVLPGELMGDAQNWEILSTFEQGEVMVLAYDTSGVGLASGPGNILKLQGEIAADAQIGDSAILAWADPILSDTTGTAITTVAARDGAVTVCAPTGAIRGQVSRYNSTRKIANAKIAVRTLEGKLAASAVSDIAGNWTIGQVASGDYRITASADGYYAESRSVTVGTEATAQANFTLVVMSKSKKNTGGVKGLVVSDAGAPLKQVKLRFYSSNGRSVGSTSTNAAGYFCKAGLLADNYTVVATKSRYQTSQTSLAVTIPNIEEATLQLEVQSVTQSESSGNATSNGDWRVF